ncbi:MAG: hypothetical protein HQ541_05300 [Mariniphaga sp.]|nr:hypothetical protein [Mariniphaga sp.]
MIKRFFLIFSLLIISQAVFSQEKDWGWWNETHGWESGMPGWRMWLIISPKYLGPNALPVPELKNGIIPEKSEIEFGADFHFKTGDPTQNLSGRCLIPFANSRIALELYGTIVEKYQMSETIRDERFARDKDGEGIIQGDFYFSTLIQITKNRKFPNTIARLGAKTASGGAYNAARVTDSPGYYLDLNFSKDISLSENTVFRPLAMVGFYSWQTNDELNLQNDALLYGAGFEYQGNTWSLTSSVTGYHGYKDNGDRPVVFNSGIKKDIGNKTVRIQYLHGIHDWEYETVKFSMIWYFDGIN